MKLSTIYQRLLCGLLVVTAITVTQEVTAIVSPKIDISVQYSVEYSDAFCSTAPNPPQVTVKVPERSVALIVMQEAATDNPQIRFTATYFGSDLGYYIDAINGTSLDLQKNCFWLFYVRDSGGNESLPVGVSSYVVPGDGYSVILRYTRTNHTTTTHFPYRQPDAKVQPLMTSVTKFNTKFEPFIAVFKELPSIEDNVVVKYVIEYRDQDVCGPGLVTPPQVDVNIPIQGSAQQVMENAVDYGQEYQFTATFFNYSIGYYIDVINGTSGNPEKKCNWLFYIRLPNDPEEFSSYVGVSNYVIPADGFTVIMRYQITEHVHETALKGLADDQIQPRIPVSILLITTLFTAIMTIIM